MKFSDVEQFFNANYACDIQWNCLERTIQKWSEDHNLVLNPEFQRGHVWTEDQQIAYVEYILRGGMSGKDIYFNHPGWMRDWRGSLLCVDGLQRLTAARKFVNNELPVFGGHYFEDFEDKMDLNCRFRFHVNDLRDYKDVLKWYVQFNSGGTVHTQEEIDRVKDMIERF